MPLVSVIIPNYNHARYLNQRVDSVLRQTFEDFELILLDDASTDGSAAILSQYRCDPRVTLVLNNRNSGSPFRQWNRGVDMTRGSYVWIAESDDYADPRFLARLVPLLQEHERVGLAYCRSWFVDEAGIADAMTDSWTRHLDANRWGSDYVNSGPDECRRFLFIQNTIPNASGVLFRKAVYESAGGAPEDRRLTGDWLTWFRMLARSDVAYVAEPLNFFRTHAQTARAWAAQSGLVMEENYRTLAQMSQELEIPLATRETVFELYAKRWVHMALFGWAGAERSVVRTARVLRIARGADPAFFRHVVRAIGRYVRDKSILRGPLKVMGSGISARRRATP